MNQSVYNQIKQRLSLRQPQADSLEALANAISATDGELLKKDHDVAAVLESLKAQFPMLSDFEREFPSLCFALATGVGKTRLMGAFITYLHQAHGINNFFVLAPNLTIYEKLITDFSPESPKYVFTGISEFAFNKPLVITGDNYEQQGARGGTLPGFEKDVRINIFNIAKINSEVRGKKAPRIKRMSEYLGESYFQHLADLDDLVMLMDESHRYRASAGVKALNDLKPVLGLELTATPFVETAKGAKPFKNVVVDYPLACAMDDGFVKEPAVVTQANFKPEDYSADELQRIKLMDGIRLHETTKTELQTYATQNGVQRVKPFILVIARDTTHAAELKAIMEAPDFFRGNYAGKIIQVDSSKTGTAEEEMISRLLAVESLDEPTEIVIHVNMLKEGWDVTNLYTIIPLRAANARTLIEQSIGRGLRLPYGGRTGVDEVDRLNIVAHDRFQAIVDAANDPENPLRIKQVILDRPEDDPTLTSVKVSSTYDSAFNFTSDANKDVAQEEGKPATEAAVDKSLVYPLKSNNAPSFAVEEESLVKQAVKVIRAASKHADKVPTSSALSKAAVQDDLFKKVKEAAVIGTQGEMFTPDDARLKEIIAQLTEWTIDQTIDIPRIMLTPKDEVQSGYHPFELDVSGVKLQPSDHDIESKSLQKGGQTLTYGQGNIASEESRPENYIIRELVTRDDVSYDDHADLINQLAHEMVQHLNSYLTPDEAEQVLKRQSHELAKIIYTQMERHYWEGETEYEVTISEGFMSLKETAFTVVSEDYYRDYQETVTDKGMIRKLLFMGFDKCLYPAQKFDSDTERQFAILLEGQSLKWFKPAKGQVNITYKEGFERPEYVPDFIAELDDSIIMVETKARKDLEADGVQKKAVAARTWCKNASDFSVQHGGKPWHYLLIPHDDVRSNMTLKHFIQQQHR